MTKINAQKYLARTLHEYGVTHVFMVPTSFMAASAEMDRLGMTVITAHGEKAAAYMADGYARVSNAPGVCHAQNIGAANLAAGLRDAYMGGSPVIALTGGMDAMTSYRHLYQEIEDFPLFKSVTKASTQLHDARRLPDLLRQLFRDATTGAPGPVHLEVDGASGQLLDVEIDIPDTNVAVEKAFRTVPAVRSAPDDELVRAALARLAGAVRPVIVAGGGVKSSQAQPELLEVATKLGIPVATSMNAKGAIDERHPLAVGVVGSYSRGSANRSLMEADLVLFVGSHTGSQVTDGWRLPAAGTQVIQIDIDGSELGRNYPNSVSILGDAKATLTRFAALIGDEQPDRSEWSARTAGYVREWREENAPQLQSDQQPMRPERICAEVNAVLADDAVLLSDTGHSGIWTSSMFDLKPGQQFIRCAGSLGWAFPASIGAKCAAGERPVVCFTGDGGFYYHLAELETAARYDIPVVVVVNNNRSLSQDLEPYHFVYDDQPTEMGEKLWKFDDVNLAETATTMGCLSYRVEDPADLADALKSALASGRPTVIDAVSEVEALPAPPYGGRSFYAKEE
jgi:acetolactate synthase I/II/III large subunit